ncbi:MAG: hypothetical protein Q8890_02535, partial [Sweet potato little leaf phytoplasma]|nr:hypothetical protein [Sweet potato little leaf phytoplasma]
MINTINALPFDAKELIFNSSVFRSKGISVSFTPLEIKDKRRNKAISKELCIRKRKILDLKRGEKIKRGGIG